MPPNPTPYLNLDEDGRRRLYAQAQEQIRNGVPAEQVLSFYKQNASQIIEKNKLPFSFPAFLADMASSMTEPTLTNILAFPASMLVGGPIGRGITAIGARHLPKVFGHKGLRAYSIKMLENPNVFQFKATNNTELALQALKPLAQKFKEHPSFAANLAKSFGYGVPFSVTHALEASRDEDGSTPIGAFASTTAFFMAFDTALRGVPGAGRLASRLIGRRIVDSTKKRAQLEPYFTLLLGNAANRYLLASQRAMGAKAELAAAVQEAGRKYVPGEDTLEHLISDRGMALLLVDDAVRNHILRQGLRREGAGPIRTIDMPGADDVPPEPLLEGLVSGSERQPVRTIDMPGVGDEIPRRTPQGAPMPVSQLPPHVSHTLEGTPAAPLLSQRNPRRPPTGAERRGAVMTYVLNKGNLSKLNDFDRYILETYPKLRVYADRILSSKAAPKPHEVAVSDLADQITTAVKESTPEERAAAEVAINQAETTGVINPNDPTHRTLSSAVRAGTGSNPIVPIVVPDGPPAQRVTKNAALTVSNIIDEAESSLAEALKPIATAYKSPAGKNRNKMVDLGYNAEQISKASDETADIIAEAALPAEAAGVAGDGRLIVFPRKLTPAQTKTLQEAGLIPATKTLPKGPHAVEVGGGKMEVVSGVDDPTVAQAEGIERAAAAVKQRRGDTKNAFGEESEFLAMMEEGRLTESTEAAAEEGTAKLVSHTTSGEGVPGRMVPFRDLGRASHDKKTLTKLMPAIIRDMRTDSPNLYGNPNLLADVDPTGIDYKDVLRYFHSRGLTAPHWKTVQSVLTSKQFRKGKLAAKRGEKGRLVSKVDDATDAEVDKFYAEAETRAERNLGGFERSLVESERGPVAPLSRQSTLEKEIAENEAAIDAAAKAVEKSKAKATKKVKSAPITPIEVKPSAAESARLTPPPPDLDPALDPQIAPLIEIARRWSGAKMGTNAEGQLVPMFDEAIPEQAAARQWLDDIATLYEDGANMLDVLATVKGPKGSSKELSELAITALESKELPVIAKTKPITTKAPALDEFATPAARDLEAESAVVSEAGIARALKDETIHGSKTGNDIARTAKVDSALSQSTLDKGRHLDPEELLGTEVELSGDFLAKQKRSKTAIEDADLSKIFIGRIGWGVSSGKNKKAVSDILRRHNLNPDERQTLEPTVWLVRRFRDADSLNEGFEVVYKGPASKLLDLKSGKAKAGVALTKKPFAGTDSRRHVQSFMRQTELEKDAHATRQIIEDFELAKVQAANEKLLSTFDGAAVLHDNIRRAFTRGSAAAERRTARQLGEGGFKSREVKGVSTETLETLSARAEASGKLGSHGQHKTIVDSLNQEDRMAYDQLSQRMEQQIDYIANLPEEEIPNAINKLRAEIGIDILGSREMAAPGQLRARPVSLSKTDPEYVSLIKAQLLNYQKLMTGDSIHLFRQARVLNKYLNDPRYTDEIKFKLLQAVLDQLHDPKKTANIPERLRPDVIRGVQEMMTDFRDGAMVGAAMDALTKPATAVVKTSTATRGPSRPTYKTILKQIDSLFGHHAGLESGELLPKTEKQIMSKVWDFMDKFRRYASRNGWNADLVTQVDAIGRDGLETLVVKIVPPHELALKGATPLQYRFRDLRKAVIDIENFDEAALEEGGSQIFLGESKDMGFIE